MQGQVNDIQAKVDALQDESSHSNSLEQVKRLLGRALQMTVTRKHSYTIYNVRDLVDFSKNLFQPSLGRRVIEDLAFITEDGIDELDCAGRTALIIAARKGRDPVVKALCNAGASLNLQSTKLGDTALIVAAAAGHVGVVQTLIKAGAEVDFQSTEAGITALIAAASAGHAGAAGAGTGCVVYVCRTTSTAAQSAFFGRNGMGGSPSPELCHPGLHPPVSVPHDTGEARGEAGGANAGAGAAGGAAPPGPPPRCRSPAGCASPTPSTSRPHT